MAIIKIYDSFITSSDTLTISTTGSSSDLKLGAGRYVYLSQSSILIDSKSFGSTQYASGFAGYGWRVDNGITYANQSFLGLDNLTVRGTMRVYELLIQQIRATNGSVFVSSTGKVTNVTSLGGSSFYLTFDTGSGVGHGFAVGDIIRAQRRESPGPASSGFLLYRSDLTVTGISSSYSITASLSSSSTPPSGGFEYVRLGNTGATANRQGTVYLTADDDNAPFIDVVDGVAAHNQWNTAGKIKVRMGRIDGITTPTFTIPANTYGFWASGSAYLEGGINATLGYIAQWTINSNSIAKGNVELNSTSEYFKLGNGVTSVLTPSSLEGTGVWISGSGQARIGNLTKYLVWDGTDLWLKTDKLNVTASTIDMTTSTFNLSSSTLVLTSNNGGKIIAGASAQTIAFGDTTRHAYISGSGEFEFVVGVNDYIRKNGTVLEISSNDFSLSGSTTLAIDNTKIVLGATAQSQTRTGSYTGFYVSSAGDFRVGQGDGNRIEFDGTTLTLSSSAFMLGNASSNISSSNGKLMITSSNFAMDASGNITASNVRLSGNITATTGNIGGWTIDSVKLYSGGLFLSASYGFILGPSGSPSASLGNLGDIASTTMGSLSGYGLYTQNVYLEGNAQLIGSLVAGDVNGIGNTFYAGLIKKNLFQKNSNLGYNFTTDFTNIGVCYYGGTWTTGTTDGVTLPNGESGTVSWVNHSVNGGDFRIGVSDGSSDYRNTDFTISVWVKCDSGLEGTYTWQASFNGDGGAPTYYTAQQYTVSTQWKRVSLSFRTNSTGGNGGSSWWDIRSYLTIPLDATKKIYFWGVQIETYKYPTTYQPSSGTYWAGATKYGMWAIAGGFGGSIQNPVVQLSGSGMYVRNIGTPSTTYGNGVYIGDWTGSSGTFYGTILSASGLYGYSGSKEVFRLDTTGAKIGGWAVTDTTLKAGNIQLSSSGEISASNFIVKANGDVTGSNVYFKNGYFSGSITSIATITGGKFRTSAGIERIEIVSESLQDSINFYNSNGNLAVSLYSTAYRKASPSVFTIDLSDTGNEAGIHSTDFRHATYLNGQILSSWPVSTYPYITMMLSSSNSSYTIGSISTNYIYSKLTYNGVYFGDNTNTTGDTNLYRSTTNTLKTDSNFIVATNLTVDGDTHIKDKLQIGTLNSVPVGFEAQSAASTVLFNMIANGRTTDTYSVSTSYPGGIFRIDLRTDYDMFQWIAKATSESEASTAMMSLASGSGNLTVKGNVTGNGSPSDIRLKNNLIKLDNVSSKLDSINAYSFTWNEKAPWSKVDTKDVGLVAQEVDSVFPDMVYKNGEYLSLNYDAITALLVQAIKEQKTIIEQQQKDIDELKAIIKRVDT